MFKGAEYMSALPSLHKHDSTVTSSPPAAFARSAALD